MAQETTTSPGTYLRCSPAFDFVLVGPVNEIVVSTNKERIGKKTYLWPKRRPSRLLSLFASTSLVPVIKKESND